jgi:hypothetical protein
MAQQSVDLDVTAQSFFHERISKAAHQLKVQLDHDVEFYLVNLLTEFINPSQLNESFETDILSTPLVHLLQKILESPENKQPIMYRRLGDTSLYIAGYFQDYFNGKAFDISYFMMMGASAYQHAATMLKSTSRGTQQTQTLNAIAHNFVQVVDVVAQASDLPGLSPKDTDILHIYDRWNKCGSERLRTILLEHGIMPVQVPLKYAQ